MCDFKSFIVTKDGGVHYSILHDSHDKLIEELKLKDDTQDAEKMRFARVEIAPLDNNVFEQDLSKWKFKIDQSITPKWWDKFLEEKCFDKLKEALAVQVLINKNTLELKNGIYFISGGTVQNVWAGGTVQNVRVGGTVRNVLDGGTVRNVWADGTVQYVWADGTVQNVRDGGTVQNVWADGTVQKLEGTGRYVKDGKIYVSDKKLVCVHENK
jgi:hypothetical protein